MSEISFVGLDPSDALRDYAHRKISTLADDGQTFSSRVVLAADRHSHAGNRFRAKFELSVRGAKVVTGARGVPFADPYAAVDAAYDEAKRVLRERSALRDARRRG